MSAAHPPRILRPRDSPLAGRPAGHFPVRPLLIGCHLPRLGTLGLLLVCADFEVLLPVVAATCLGDRAARTPETLFATRVAGDRRATYQGLSRSAANAGHALGAGIAAVGLAVGTREAYRALILADALSFVSVLHRRTCLRRLEELSPAAAPGPPPGGPPAPAHVAAPTAAPGAASIDGAGGRTARA